MINLSLNKLKQIVKSISIKDYKSKSKEYLIKILSNSKPKITFFKKKQKIEHINKEFSKLRHSLGRGFSKSKINEFIRSLYNIKIKKKSSHTKNKRD